MSKLGLQGLAGGGGGGVPKLGVGGLSGKPGAVPKPGGGVARINMSGLRNPYDEEEAIYIEGSNPSPLP